MCELALFSSIGGCRSGCIGQFRRRSLEGSLSQIPFWEMSHHDKIVTLGIPEFQRYDSEVSGNLDSARRMVSLSQIS